MPSHIHHLANTTRSFRRFRENYPVTKKLMTEWIDNARVTASAKNAQPLKYRIITDKDMCANVFETLAWAGYLTDWNGPKEGERPTGYIVMVNDTTIAPTAQAHFDAGIAAQTIMMSSTEEGFGGCIIMSFKKKQLKDVLNIPEHLDPVFVLALGRPIEDVRLTKMENGDYKYYRDENGVHYVPKRPLEDILF